MKRPFSNQNIPAHGKINLSLEIRGRRVDGFHEVATRIAKISLADEIHFFPSQSGEFEFTCTEPDLPTGEENLVVRAADSFRKRTGAKLDLRIHLVKNIPHGAGLGGGSSDAASTLTGLNELFAAGISDDDLRAMGAELGSDIPFFIGSTVADCGGRGEMVSRVDFPYELPIVLLKPDFAVSTPWAYGRWANAKKVPGFTYVPQITPWGSFENHLEAPVFEKFLVLGEMKRWLLSQPEVHTALMSGSGSTLFAVLRDPFVGIALEERARETFGDSTWTSVGHTLASISDD